MGRRAGRTTFERTAKPCGPDASTLAFKSRASEREVTVTNKPDHRGERGISRKAITQGMPGASAELVCSCAHPLLLCARDRGCSAHPAFPAPSGFEGERYASLGRVAPREREGMYSRVKSKGPLALRRDGKGPVRQNDIGQFSPKGVAHLE